MKRGSVGALLFATLAVTFFVSPNAAPPAATSRTSFESAAKPSRAALASPANPERRPHLATECATNVGGPCGACLEFCPAQGLLEAIGEYFGPRPDERDLAAHWGVPQKARANTRFIVATVADPVHTHLSLFFDRQIDAIQEAVQADGYLFARSYVPWDPNEHPEDTDFRIRLAQEKYRAETERYPGLMIFRQAGKEPSELSRRRHLLVFLVAETPTGGVNKSQFRAALRTIQEICTGDTSCKPSSREGVLSILGPTFSGSLYSLAVLLRDDVKDSFSTAIIHSGTASSQATIDYFQSFVKTPAGAATSVPKNEYENVGALDVQFRAFQESYEYALDRMIRFACDRGYTARDVAVVSEDETAYGSVDVGWSKAPAKPTRAATGRPGRGAASTGESKPCVNKDDVLHLYFPRDIAQLRSAYQHDLQAQNAAEASKPRARSSLQLDLSDTGTDDDSVAHFSRSTTPLSQEGIMLGLVANLQKRHVVFVVVTATNPLDMLFLVRYFRSAYSEGRVVTVDTDLLLPRELDDQRLHGVMEITSYSLIPGAGDNIALPDSLHGPSRLYRVFPSNYNAGTFNALLSLLVLQDQPNLEVTCESTKGSPAEGRCADLPPAGYAEYGWPNLAGEPLLPDCPTPSGGLRKNCPLAPPLWLTVLGHSGYWPVALLDTEPSRDDPDDPASEIHAVNDEARVSEFHRGAPQPWITLCWFFVVMALAYIYLVWRGSIGSLGRPVVKFAPKPDIWRNLILFAAHLLVVCLLLSLFWPWVRWASHLDDHAFGVFLFVFALLVIAVLATDMSVRASRRWATAFLIACLALYTYAILPGAASGPQINFTLHRYIHVTSGVSPIIPGVLLVFGGLWWCWYNLEGVVLWEQPGFQFLPSLGDIRSSHERSERDTAARVRLYALTVNRNADLLRYMHPVGQFGAVVFPSLLTLILGVSLVGLHHPIRALEGSKGDSAYCLALLFASFVLLCELYGLRMIWLELRRLLNALDRLPLRRAFHRMEVYAWKPLWQLGGSALEDFVPIVSHQFEALSRLHNSNPDDRLREAIIAAEKQREEFALLFQNLIRDPRAAVPQRPLRIEDRLRRATRGTDADSTIQTIGAIAALQAVLASTCAVALQYLNSAWDRETTPVWRDQDECGEKDDKQIRSQLAPATRFAEDFVCLFYFNFISSVFMRMRTMVMTVAGIFVFALLSFSSYPFEPRDSFHTVVICFFLLIVAVIGFAFAQMHRDPILSRITKTTPGELGIDFWIRITTFVAAPLLSLLASQFPAVSGPLFGWLQPALQALK